MIFKRGVAAIACAIALLTLSMPGLCDDNVAIVDSHRLHREQQLDAMSLSIGQSLTNSQAANLEYRQRLQLQQLELQQRMQQQQLEQQQLRHSYRARDLRSESPSTGIAQIQIEQRQFSQERRQQLHEFEVQRQRQLQQFQWERQQRQLMMPLAPPRFSLR